MEMGPSFTALRPVALVLLTVSFGVAPDRLLARPAVLEEVAKVALPDANNVIEIDIDGDDLFVVTLQFQASQYALHHYERQSDGAWISRGEIAHAHFDMFSYRMWLEVEGGIGAFSAGENHAQILERTASGWRVLPSPVPSGSDVAVHGGTIALGGTTTEVRSVVNLIERNAEGAWIHTATLQGPPGEYDGDFIGPEIELAANELAQGNPYDDIYTHGYLTYIYDRVQEEWQLTWTLDYPLSTYVINDRLAHRSGSWYEAGDVATFYTRTSIGTFTVRQSLLTDEWYADRRPSHVVFEGNLAFAGTPEDDGRGQDAGSVTVFARTDPQRFTQVATLVASDALANHSLGAGSIDASGRRVAVAGAGGIYIFELPDPLPATDRSQDTFEDGNFAGWTPVGSANWRVVSAGGSQVFRQTSTQGDPKAIFDGFEGRNQSIEADLKLTSAADPRRWAGLMARYTDALNFYYLMNGRDNTLQIRKMVNGVHSPIASTPFTLQLGRSYRFRLEAIGEWLRGYVDGRLMLEVRDTSHPQGRTGLTMWKATVDYDNVVITSNPYTVLHKDSFSGTADEEATPPWTTSPADAWTRATTSTGATVFRQSLASGDAHAVHGSPTEDQIITADIRQPASGPGWAGLMARYVSNLTHYYVFLKDSEDKISLRRLMDRRITVLDEAPLTVTPGTSYRVRFEAIGSSLRVYLNDTLMLEAEDSALPMGQYGLVTYRAAAEFDNFSAVRP